MATYIMFGTVQYVGLPNCADSWQYHWLQFPSVQKKMCMNTATIYVARPHFSELFSFCVKKENLEILCILTNDLLPHRTAAFTSSFCWGQQSFDVACEHCELIRQCLAQGKIRYYRMINLMMMITDLFFLISYFYFSHP